MPSYAQNVLQHSVEVCLFGIMAAELGLNVKHAKRAGILHDIGKAVDQESEGVHALIGADLAKRHGESPKVVHAITTHRDTPARKHSGGPGPGGRHPFGGAPGRPAGDAGDLRQAFGRTGKVALSFGGISKSYAIQAGREIRLIVESEKVNNEESGLASPGGG